MRERIRRKVRIDSLQPFAVLIGNDYERAIRGREGRVSYVSPTAEFTPRNVQTRDERAKLVYRVKIRVENQDGAMKPGMPADAIVETP